MLSPHNKPAFLALIPALFTSLNPFVTIFRPLQPRSSSHNREKYENSRFHADAYGLYRKCSHAKQAEHTKSSRLWTSEEISHTELSTITFYDYIIYLKLCYSPKK